MHRTKEFASVIAYGRYRILPNSLSYSLVQGMLWTASKTGVMAFWKEKFGALPDGFGCPYEKVDARHPAVISCSNFVFKRPSDWNENIHQDGYWFLEENADYAPPKALEDFLHAGDAPIYIGFGSVFRDDEKDEFIRMMVSALNETGKRGIICGMGEISGLPDSIFSIQSIPHSWLFPRVAAVCHHGGAGTTAAGFAAGIPSIIVPFSNDQFAWAHRAFDLGVGSKPIPKKKLTHERLATAIQFATSPQVAENAKRLGANIATECGAKEAAKVIAACSK